MHSCGLHKHLQDIKKETSKLEMFYLAPDRYIIAIVIADIPIPNINASLSVVLTSGALESDSDSISLAPV